MRLVAAFTFILTLFVGMALAEEVPNLGSSLTCPRYSNENQVKVTGFVEGERYEKMFPIEGPDGLYPLVVRAQGKSGKQYTEHLAVIKDTKPPKLRALRFPRKTKEDSIQITGIVDRHPFEKIFEIPGRAKEHTVDLVFLDEAGNRTFKRLRIIKERESRKLTVEAVVQLREAINSLAKSVDRLSRRISVWGNAARKALVSQEVRSVFVPKNKPASEPLPTPPPATPVPAPSAAPKATQASAPVAIDQTKLKQMDNGVRMDSSADAPRMKMPKDAKPQTEKSEYGFGETRKIQMPDAQGGMTITIDNIRTNKRTIIKKDLTGKELSRQSLPLPQLDKEKK